MRGSNSRPGVPEAATGEEIEWEQRPCGMLVQRREDGAGTSGPLIRVKVSHGTSQHEVTVPAQYTFGELKKVLAQKTGLEPQEQRLLFRGKEKDNDDCLHIAGVKDLSKVILMEDPASKERKIGEMKRNQGVSKACDAVLRVRSEVDKLAGKVSAHESTVHRGIKIADKEFVVLTELLMRQILQLDSIEAEGEAKIQRRIEVRRVQNLVDTVDNLKVRNANPVSSSSKSVSVTTRWEKFETGIGSLAAPRPRAASTQITQDWEDFD